MQHFPFCFVNLEESIIFKCIHFSQNIRKLRILFPHLFLNCCVQTFLCKHNHIMIFRKYERNKTPFWKGNWKIIVQIRTLLSNHRPPEHCYSSSCWEKHFTNCVNKHNQTSAENNCFNYLLLRFVSKFGTPKRQQSWEENC